jgi:allantoin permease
LFNVKTAAILTAIIGTMILPWKLVNGTQALYMFYSFIGSMYGPITGIMLASFFLERKRKLNLSAIYLKKGDNGEYKSGYNVVACAVLVISFFITLSGAIFKDVAVLAAISKSAFLSGLIISGVLYALTYRLNKQTIVHTDEPITTV